MTGSPENVVFMSKKQSKAGEYLFQLFCNIFKTENRADWARSLTKQGNDSQKIYNSLVSITPGYIKKDPEHPSSETFPNISEFLLRKYVNACGLPPEKVLDIVNMFKTENRLSSKQSSNLMGLVVDKIELSKLSPEIRISSLQESRRALMSSDDEIEFISELMSLIKTSERLGLKSDLDFIKTEVFPLLSKIVFQTTNKPLSERLMNKLLEFIDYFTK